MGGYSSKKEQQFDSAHMNIEFLVPTSNRCQRLISTAIGAIKDYLKAFCPVKAESSFSGHIAVA